MSTDLISDIANDNYFSKESIIMIVSSNIGQLREWAKFTQGKTHRTIIDITWLRDYLSKREEIKASAGNLKFIRAELLFHLQAIIVSENARILIDEVQEDSDLWSAQLKRIGVQTIYIGVSGSWDVGMLKIEDAKLIAEGRVYLSGLRMNVSGQQAVMYSRFKDMNVISAFGRAVRGNAMKYAKRMGDVYVGLGDRAESVDWGLKMHVKCEHFGANLLAPREYTNEGASSAPMVPTVSSQGQRKLEVIHNAFLMQWKPGFVFYLGGSPGYSLFDYLVTYTPKVLIRDPGQINDNIRGLVSHDARPFSAGDIVPLPQSENAMVMNDIRPKRHKKGMLVIAPSGAGKSFYSKLGYWKDGDSLVTWPKTHRWWESMAQEAQVRMGTRHLEQLSKYAKSEKVVIAFNPNYEALTRMDFQGTPVVVWMPDRKIHMENIARRRAEGNDMQPDDVKMIDDMRDKLTRIANARGWLIAGAIEDVTHDMEWEVQVANDYGLMKQTMIDAKGAGYRSYIGKFRVPSFWTTFDLPRGARIFMQPWAGSNSTEGRVVVDLKNWDGTFTKEFAASWINQVRQWNFERYHDPTKNIQQERSLYELCIRVTDFILDPPKVEGMKFALWSTSNVYNSSNYRETVKAARFTLYPNVHVAKSWVPGMCDIWYYRDYFSFCVMVGGKTWRLKRKEGQWVAHDGSTDLTISAPQGAQEMRFFNLTLYSSGQVKVNKFDSGLPRSVFPIYISGQAFTAPFMVQKTGDTFYYDYLSDPNMLVPGYRWMNARDFVVFAQYTGNGQLYKDVCKEGFDFTHPISSLWGMWFDVREFTWHHDLQTWLNGQTQWTKTMTSSIRRLTGYSEAKMHVWRRMALSLLYERTDCACRACTKSFIDFRIVIRNHDRVNGVLYDDKRKTVHLVAVAGHMIGMLLASSMGTVDMNRYCDTVLGNFMVHSKEDSFKSLKSWSSSAGALGLLGETNYKKGHHLWHSYYDFYSAVATYILICSIFKMRVNLRGVLIVMKMLRRIKKLKAAYDDGWQAKEIGLSGLGLK